MQKPVLSSVWGSLKLRGLWQGKGGAGAAGQLRVYMCGNHPFRRGMQLLRVLCHVAETSG